MQRQKSQSGLSGTIYRNRNNESQKGRSCRLQLVRSALGIISGTGLGFCLQGCPEGYTTYLSRAHYHDVLVYVLDNAGFRMLR